MKLYYDVSFSMGEIEFNPKTNSGKLGNFDINVNVGVEVNADEIELGQKIQRENIENVESDTKKICDAIGLAADSLSKSFYKTWKDVEEKEHEMRSLKHKLDRIFRKEEKKAEKEDAAEEKSAD